jgi:hypothetical protein
MQVINNNELFTQVAAEESSVVSGGDANPGGGYSNYDSYMHQPYYGNAWRTPAPETSATFLPLLKTTGFITLAEAFSIESSAMQLKVLELLAGV